jgi:hypothetical protein
MRKFAVLFLLAAATFVPAFAAQVQYTIYFQYLDSLSFDYSGNSLPPSPISGSFVYDPSALAADGVTPAGFLSFDVNWQGQTFDLTSAANNLVPNPQTGCDSSVGGSPYAFLLMTEKVTGCDAKYGWLGQYFGASGIAVFSFVLNPGGTSQFQDVLTAGVPPFSPDPSTLFAVADGSWTVSPEPGTLGMMLFGAVAVAGMKRARSGARRVTPAR